MARGTPTAEREGKRKARTNEYLDSQLKKLREKLSNAKTTKEKQRIRTNISSLKNRLGPKTKRSFIKSKNPLTKTSRGLRIRPKKTEKKSTIRKVDYKPTIGKVEETNYKPRADAKVIKDKQNKAKTPSYKPRAEAKVIKNKQTLKVKKDPLADYRRGPGTKLGKDTRITKGLKKAGFTEDRLARLRKKHAEFKAKRKKKKQS